MAAADRSAISSMKPVINSKVETIYGPEPSVALCVCTYGAPAHVHLQLESHRRLYPKIPIMVHEDSSDQYEAVKRVCNEYQVKFMKTVTRQGHQEGDLSGIIRALEFAHGVGVDLVVKVSRTYIPTTNFVPSLQKVAYETQYAAFSNVCTGCGYGYRTECAAWHVRSYIEGIGIELMREAVVRRSGWFNFVEAYLHRVVRKVCEQSACNFNLETIRKECRPLGEDGYGAWDWIGTNCREKDSRRLWHRSDEPMDYYQLSESYGLPYRYEDFVIEHF